MEVCGGTRVPSIPDDFEYAKSNYLGYDRLIGKAPHHRRDTANSLMFGFETLCKPS